MVTKWVAGAAMAVMALSLAACNKGVDGKAIASPPAGEWLGHGRDYFEQRFSPLDKINASNIKDLGLAWHFDFGDRQGLEATPIVHDGVIYVSTDFSEVWAFDARTGQKLWSAPTQADVVAAPSTYTIGGEQYVALLVGARGLPPGQARTNPLSANNSRLLVYKLNANATLPQTPIAGSVAGKVLDPPLLTGTNEQVIDGEGAYGRFCSGCHGAGGTADKSIPDLRYSPTLRNLTTWNSIVLDGARADKGMVSFKKVLAEGQAEAIYHYIVSQANKTKAAQEASVKK
jgi:mono/diheme cytochrome c family protein